MSAAAVDRLRHLFAENKLGVPPVPSIFAEEITERGLWHFATREIGLSPYNLAGCIAQSVGDCEDYLLAAHAGYGSNSYAVHYYMVWRPLRLFVQVGWGGVYMGERESVAVRECMTLITNEVKVAAGWTTRSRASSVTCLLGWQPCHRTVAEHPGAKGVGAVVVSGSCSSAP